MLFINCFYKLNTCLFYIFFFRKIIIMNDYKNIIYHHFYRFHFSPEYNEGEVKACLNI